MTVWRVLKPLSLVEARSAGEPPIMAVRRPRSSVEAFTSGLRSSISLRCTLEVGNNGSFFTVGALRVVEDEEGIKMTIPERAEAQALKIQSTLVYGWNDARER